MDQTIGKYRIIERIGRGGMGSVYKAHDPVLDRLVALKVVSAETDHTDELRARFFREAQACAKLSHPNIVTIHDLGEADGNLYIVMELLEGDELRQLIAKKTLASIEDKFPLMIQICDGLEFAHEKGIVHRDVKPANIFVLRNGQVKILDFGIAHIAAAQTGLTRAGLIVGTLQYMAPERARGQGSHHSDIFSVGAVFYELLTNKAPFTGNDPIEILENLRSQDPPPLAEVDPSLPTELGAILERALQKDPTRRFATLGQMRAQLIQVRRKLSEDAERVRRDVQSRLRRIHELREALTARLGGPWADETVFVVEDHAPLATLERVDKDTTARIERMQELLTRAEALRPALDRGLAALQRGDYEQAVSDLDRVVTEMPEHARAAESLREAQHHVDAQNQSRERLTSLMREATAAYDAGAFARCLEILRSLADSAAPAAAPPEAAALRSRAEAAIAREQAEEASRIEARRRAVEAATAMRGQAEIARRDAEVAAAPRHQATLWHSAESKFSAGQSALAGEAYAQGERHFQEARQIYEQAAAGAREAQAAAAAAALRAEMAKQAAAAAKPARDSADETVFVDTARILSEPAVTASIASPPATPVASPLTVSMPAPPTASVAAPPTGPIAAPPTSPVVTPPTSRVAGPIAAPASPVSAGGTTAPPAAERVWPAPVAAPSVSMPSVPTPRAPARSPLSALPMRYLAIAGGGLAVVLVALIVWLSGGHGGAPDKGLEQLIATVAAARDRATKADAPALAADLLSKADASRTEGERLGAARDAAGSTKAYQMAVERYGEAERQAQLKREQRTEADAARAKMAAEKQRASQDAPDFGRALELERQGGAMYAQLAFTDATTSFRTAGELFAKAVTPATTTPAPAPPVAAAPAPAVKAPPAAPASPPTTAAPAPATGPRADIRALLDNYVRAVETKDVELMRRVRPSLTDEEVRRLRQSNEIKKSHKVDLRVYDITLNGDEATADGRREDVVVLSSGQRLQTETKFSYTLKHGSRGWVIDQVRESADRPAETRPAQPRVPRRSDAAPR
jgi:protein kinase-like protein